MSDRELALAIRELNRNAASEPAKQIRTSAMAQLRKGQLSINEEDALLAERSHKVVAQALQVLRAPAPDTFLGRKTEEPFPNGETE
jgi:hypothetical protein